MPLKSNRDGFYTSNPRNFTIFQTKLDIRTESWCFHLQRFYPRADVSKTASRNPKLKMSSPILMQCQCHRIYEVNSKHFVVYWYIRLLKCKTSLDIWSMTKTWGYYRSCSIFAINFNYFNIGMKTLSLYQNNALDVTKFNFSSSTLTRIIIPASVEAVYLG